MSVILLQQPIKQDQVEVALAAFKTQETIEWRTLHGKLHKVRIISQPTWNAVKWGPGYVADLEVLDAESTAEVLQDVLPSLKKKLG